MASSVPVWLNSTRDGLIGAAAGGALEIYFELILLCGLRESKFLEKAPPLPLSVCLAWGLIASMADDILTQIGDALIAATAIESSDELATFETKHFPGLRRVVKPDRWSNSAVAS
jgi:hypothetical protein